MKEPVEKFVRALRDLDERVAELLDRVRVALAVERDLVLCEEDLVLEQLFHDRVHVGLVESLAAQLPSLREQPLLHQLHLPLSLAAHPADLRPLSLDDLPQLLDLLLKLLDPGVSLESSPADGGDDAL